jgi:hypothetical protein
VINDFAFTFLCGILTGTYSTIYIASFLVLEDGIKASARRSALPVMPPSSPAHPNRSPLESGQ